MKNIKVDIIYYTIGTDFEMEFNLCGCCRMRLLTDTVTTRNEFSKSLARAVSRSNIIMACGPIFGEKGLVSTVSKVTNISTEVINNQKYGIDDQSEISILKDSTPLVTSDGVFCGCIIENGPQVIVLLTESKSLRKKIMKELIHPYVAQWSMVSDDDTEITSVSKMVEEKNNQIKIKTEDSDDEEAKEEITPINIDNDEYVLDPKLENDNGNNDKDDSSESYKTNSFGSDKSVERRNMEYYLQDEDYDDFEGRPRSKLIIILIIFIILFAVMILFFGVIRPLLSGYNISDFWKSIFTPRSNSYLSILR